MEGEVARIVRANLKTKLSLADLGEWIQILLWSNDRRIIQWISSH